MTTTQCDKATLIKQIETAGLIAVIRAESAAAAVDTCRAG